MVFLRIFWFKDISWGLGDQMYCLVFEIDVFIFFQQDGLVGSIWFFFGQDRKRFCVRVRAVEGLGVRQVQGEGSGLAFCFVFRWDESISLVFYSNVDLLQFGVKFRQFFIFYSFFRGFIVSGSFVFVVEVLRVGLICGFVEIVTRKQKLQLLLLGVRIRGIRTGWGERREVVILFLGIGVRFSLGLVQVFKFRSRMTLGSRQQEGLGVKEVIFLFLGKIVGWWGREKEKKLLLFVVLGKRSWLAFQQGWRQRLSVNIRDVGFGRIFSDQGED